MATFAVKIGTYAVGTEAAVEAIKVIRTRRVQQYPIIREDLTLIPEGKQQPLQIEIRGTIAGSDYTSLRSELEQIANALEGGRQNFYIDNERFVRVLSQSMDYSFITKDFCNYNIRFTSELPYFLAETVSSSIQTPTSGATFPITNNGHIRVPLRVVIRPVASGTTIVNQQIENATLGLLGLYTGIVGATSDVTIDAGYANTNAISYVVTLDGVAAMSAWQGDFPFLKDGVNYLEYTGVANATMWLYWREGFRA